MDARRSFTDATWNYLRSHPYTCVCLLVLSVLTSAFLFRHDLEWEHVYVEAARRLANGQDLYELKDGYLYPPFMAWATLPFSTLSHLPGRAAWWLVNIVCLFVIIRGAWHLAGGGRLQGMPRVPRREHLALLLGGASGFLYLHNCLAHRQADVVSAAFLIGGCLALHRTRSMLAATFFGLAAAMKCTPLLWAPYLVWRGRPLAALWLVVVAAAVNLLPDLTHPAASGHPWLLEYYTRYLQPLTVRDHFVGTWIHSDIIYNQSLAGTANRWLLTRLTWEAQNYCVVPCSVAIAPSLFRALVWSFEFLLLGAVLVVCGRPFRALEGEPDGVRRAPLEYSIVFMLMLLLSPMSSKAHFGLLILPGFLLGRAVFYSRRSKPDASATVGAQRFEPDASATVTAQLSGALTLLLAGALLATCLACKDLLGNHVHTFCLWCGTATWNTLFLLVGCLILLAREPELARQSTQGERRGVSPPVNATRSAQHRALRRRRLRSVDGNATVSAEV